MIEEVPFFVNIPVDWASGNDLALPVLQVVLDCNCDGVNFIFFNILRLVVSYIYSGSFVAMKNKLHQEGKRGNVCVQ